jgi:hypothetical protein
MTPTTELHLRAERAPFVMLPRWLLYHPEVGEGAKFLYCVLHDLVAGREGPTRPVTRAQLAESCGVSVDTIDRRLTQLVAAGAVEKQAQIRAGGQAANVYQVWLTPPDGFRRTTIPHGKPERPETPVENGSRSSAAPVEGSANGQVSRRRDPAAPPSEPDGHPQPCGDLDRASAAPSVFEEPAEEDPPQPPRTAGGHDAPHNNHFNGVPRRTAGMNPRALGANPRAEADRAEESRQRQLFERREAELAGAAAARRVEEDAARAAAAAFEAEATALSAVLDDNRLAAITGLATDGLAGPLARSPFAVTRAVVTWCRAAAALLHPHGQLLEAVDAALADRWRPAPDDPGSGIPLDLPAPSASTPGLRHRLACLLRPDPPEPGGSEPTDPRGGP